MLTQIWNNIKIFDEKKILNKRLISEIIIPNQEGLEFAE